MANNTDLQIAADVLADGRYLSLATTSSDGSPWCSPLFYGLRENLEFVTISSRSSRHGANIRENSRAAWAIYWGEKAPEETDGLMFEGTAREIADLKELQSLGDELYDQRFPDPSERTLHPFDASAVFESGRALYVLTPSAAFKVDRTDPHGVSRVPVDLSALSEQGITHPV